MRRYLALYLLMLNFIVSVTTKALANEETFSTIDFPGAISTSGMFAGINARGDITGSYTGAEGRPHGFC